jgi:hypothetical protein
VSYPRLARLYYAVGVTLVIVGVGISISVATGAEGGHFGSPQGRIFNVFMFFTNQANLLVGLAWLLLALRLDRRSTAFGALWLTGLVGITVTAVVHHTMLAHLYEPTGMDVVGDAIRHTVVPVMTWVGWLVLGPRRFLTGRAVWWTLVFPAAFTLLTVVRGHLLEWYPYPFVDVIDLGYAPAVLNGVAIIGGYVALAAVLRLVDSRLPPSSGFPPPKGESLPSHFDDR